MSADTDEQCGLGCFRPAFLQRCARVGVFVALYSPVHLCTSAITVYMSSQITTLEKQFGFNSTQSGFLMSCNDIGFLLITIFVAHLARNVHIPRSLFFSTFLFGLSGIFCSLAYFLAPDNHKEQNLGSNSSSEKTDLFQNFHHQLCSQLNNTPAESCDPKVVKIGAPTEFTTVAIVIIAVCMMAQGFGKAPRQPYIITYIDDNIPKRNTACYLGIITAVGMFGPGLGFGLGAVFSQMYFTLEEVQINVRDPRWIGAWWLGFIVFGALAVVVSFPLMCFPKRMPGRKKKELPKKAEAESSTKSGFMAGAKDLIRKIIRILSNARFTLNMFASCLVLFLVGGFIAFTPKYLETQFSVPVYYANALLGVIILVTTFCGSLVGGLLTTFKKLHPYTCIKLVGSFDLFSIIFHGLGFVLGCQNPRIIGLDNTVANSTCLNACNCDSTVYLPVCGSDNRNYLTPCHAGCGNSISGPEGIAYTNCTCIEGVGTATPGLCKTDCEMFWPFLILSAVYCLFVSICIVPSIMFSVRCVSDEDKSVAVAVSSLFQTILGWMIGPMITGKIIDTCCKLWSSNCYGKGACALYDIEDFRYKKYTVEIIVKCVVVVLIGAAIWISRNRTDWSTEDDEKNFIPEKEELMVGAEKAQAKFEISDPIVKNRKS
ncbi:solute carrier organic anion transporter family member 2B1-like isoform X1 [Saccostrea echinata]|uniref:solute carrier organic anion transporter family member 2B1-like isoform X1 n=1 Tax=Saccostrea echinata TaxID=191078 RepID=UPI002A831E7D|nr:solute carrier organic anion transporter family member 2B1-like isoform X1 [Saccostrea echinata]XP_061168480.1 solute carrier organic anion transporter family member 2B1-like isoform X1 [Saccostrea echinata]XP_061168481.1 solute carrier organic anion transporter family member 2B1-like isoform X1 [Saccostrea echinata]